MPSCAKLRRTGRADRSTSRMISSFSAAGYLMRRPPQPRSRDYIREGDVLVVCKLDRLARSTQHLLEIVERVRRTGAHLNVLNLGMDTSTATGKLLLTMMGAIGQFEREMM